VKPLVNLKKNSCGFTLVEVMIALALISVFVFIVLDYSSVLGKHTNLNRSSSTRNRILSGIRDLAGMPASLRVSMRASSGGVAINPKLLACAGGNPANDCTTGEEIPFTLYSPIIQRDSSGAILGIVPISAPYKIPITNPMRIDTYGAHCSVASPSCPLMVFTSFKAQCGPPPMPLIPLSPITLEFVPRDKCTVADVIEVTYYVLLDTTVEGYDPALISFLTPAQGSVVVPVVAISGNVPQ